MKILLQLVKPKYFIPMHGEYRQLFRHSALAEQLGAVGGANFPAGERPAGGIHCRMAARIAAIRCTAGRVMVDSGSLEEIEEVVIRDRRHLSEDGVVVPIMVINKHTGLLETPPEIVSRGFLPSDDGAEILNAAREVVLKTLENSTPEEKSDWSVIKEKIRSDLKRYLNKQTAKRPMILPVILEV